MKDDQSTFCTAINCIHGAVQEPVASFTRKHFGADYTDMITHPAPATVIDEQRDLTTISSILFRTTVSLEAHESKGIALAAHANCAGTPETDEVQQQVLRQAVIYLKHEFPDMEVIGLWVDADAVVTQIKEE